MTTVRDLSVGVSFKLFARYRDGSRRPRLKYGSDGVRLKRAYLRLNNHSIGGCEVLITRTPIDFTQDLTVVEHLKGDVTMVRDEQFRLAPIYSGMTLQMRQPQQNNRPRTNNTNRSARS